MPALTDDHFQPRKAMKNAFRDPSQSDKMCFEYQTIKFQWKKWVKVFTFAYGQVSLTVKYPFFDDFP